MKAGGFGTTTVAATSISAAAWRQSATLIHSCNLYYNPWQGELARRLVKLTGPGKIFFCNSGAEANEGLIKLARKWGHESGRYEIITATNSFHGRTMATLSATGQEKIQHGFEPLVPGFRHVPYNDLAAVEAVARVVLAPETRGLCVLGPIAQGAIRFTPAPSTP